MPRFLNKIIVHFSPGKGQFSFQFQRKAMPKNVQTTIQLHSFHMLARLCSKSFKLGFSTVWTKRFQMYKLDWKRQRNQRSNCQQSLDPEKAKFQEKNIYFCFFDYAKAFECMDHKKTVENSKMDENTRPPYLSPQKLVCRTRSNS